MWTISELREALEECPRDSEVFLNNRHPKTLTSWRGHYSQLAITVGEMNEYEETKLIGGGPSFELNMAGYGTYTPGASEVQIKQPATVGDLIEALDLADGTEFEGYKGGQYMMHGDTDVYASEWGDAGHMRPYAIENLPGRVDIMLKDDPW